MNDGYRELTDSVAARMFTIFFPQRTKLIRLPYRCRPKSTWSLPVSALAWTHTHTWPHRKHVELPPAASFCDAKIKARRLPWAQSAEKPYLEMKHEGGTGGSNFTLPCGSGTRPPPAWAAAWAWQPRPPSASAKNVAFPNALNHLPLHRPSK